ncbi:MAG: 50S ribosomal protein L29 [Eubacteriales bacterium]|jgi:large subunit ribosomal protein L29|nr:50S ribosomal protein L29 [Eubacteriales bacterium]MDD3109293.1 50S ribosomal protein L29 [Eubacteriales bacterium]MDD3571777.1 50S ribosomal protein L29 [Eubacteriales bacterium]MDD4134333.1 50S ribosomal protein L29 [Eubacteriales bacterium]NLO13136.1 50S ribosomal protein L29 [Clostridiales bacterium]
MKVSEYLAMKPEELTAKINELKTELFNLRFQLATGQLENTMQIQAVKRDIARALTAQTQASKKADKAG